MILMGITDEAGISLDAQIKATKALGWKYIEARNVQVDGHPAGNIHDIPEAAFEALIERIRQEQLGVYCFSSTIANWGKKIDEPVDSSIQEARRAIPRMQLLGTKYIRIMSFAIRNDEDQMEQERFKRLREIVKMFLDAGIQPLHENCMNYGGMGWPFMLKLLDNVPGLKVVFDTGNPVFNDDRSKPKPWPKQDAWEFYCKVKEFIAHIHIKDGIWDPIKKEMHYTYPGEGQGAVKQILRDLIKSGYKGGISIEPHLASVFHDSSVKTSQDYQFSTFIEYGKRLMNLIDTIKSELGNSNEDNQFKPCGRDRG
jgi:sugar phosphate isomerase/epimerase